MPSELVSQDLIDAKLDVEHIAELATSTQRSAVDRLGQTKKTWAGVVEDLGAAYAVTTTGANRLAAEEAKRDAEASAQAAADAMANAVTKSELEEALSTLGGPSNNNAATLAVLTSISAYLRVQAIQLGGA
jgi:hypothetical protein